MTPMTFPSVSRSGVFGAEKGSQAAFAGDLFFVLGRGSGFHHFQIVGTDRLCDFGRKKFAVGLSNNVFDGITNNLCRNGIAKQIPQGPVFDNDRLPRSFDKRVEQGIAAGEVFAHPVAFRHIIETDDGGDNLPLSVPDRAGVRQYRAACPIPPLDK